MAVIFALGYSANTITLIALVLAIGVVVDDAILVVENVQRVMEDDPEIGVVEATRTAMGQITGPIVATTFVLLAVVLPTAFLPGINGQLSRPFAVTLSAALGVSAIGPRSGERRGGKECVSTGRSREGADPVKK